MKKCDAPSNADDKKKWLFRFEKMLQRNHRIIVKHDDLSLRNFVEKRDEVNLSKITYKDLDEQLYSWVLEQKQLEDTINYQMF